MVSIKESLAEIMSPACAVSCVSGSGVPDIWNLNPSPRCDGSDNHALSSVDHVSVPIRGSYMQSAIGGGSPFKKCLSFSNIMFAAERSALSGGREDAALRHADE